MPTKPKIHNQSESHPNMLREFIIPTVVIRCGHKLIKECLIYRSIDDLLIPEAARIFAVEGWRKKTYKEITDSACPACTKEIEQRLKEGR